MKVFGSLYSGPLATALLAVVALASVGCLDVVDRARVEQGEALLGDWSPEENPALRLSGAWDFFPGRLDVSADDAAPYRISVPGPWTEARPLTGAASARADGPPEDTVGAAGYRLRLQLPEALVGRELGLKFGYVASAYQVVYLHPERGPIELGGVGRVGATREASEPEIRSDIYGFVPAERETVILVRVSNFRHSKGGLRQPILLGPYESVRRIRETAVFRDALLFGGILLMGLYHLGLYINRREEPSTLYFGLFCLLLAVRVLCTGEHFIRILWPGLDYVWQLRLEYWSFLLAAPAVVYYAAAAFHERRGLRIPLAFLSVAVACSLFVLVAPPYWFSFLVAPYWGVITLCIVYCGWLLLRGRRVQGPASSAAFAVGALLLALSITYDFFVNLGFAPGPYVAPMGLLAFIFAQSYFLARLFAGAFRAVQELSERVRRINYAYGRFVPLEFLTQLRKRDITEIGLGDQVNRRMAVLISDIRSFTSLSESMTPDENFNFLNAYFGRMSPIVDHNGGFVDKFIGDAVMALFPDGPEPAVRAAIEMQAKIREYNEERIASGFDPIQVGIGVHYGELMLGTIGAEQRMDSTVISDAVNVAFRLESLTKVYGANILISRAVSEEIDGIFAIRRIGAARIKGKRREFEVFEAIDGLSEDRRALAEETRGDFEAGLAALENGDREAGLDFMRRVLRRDPEDAAAWFYVLQSEEAVVHRPVIGFAE